WFMSSMKDKQGPTLLTISEACHVLGVSEAALRQWTDEGKVKAFVTPGGHRRYAESELRAMMRQPRMQGLRELGDRVESVVPRERELARQFMESSRWYGQLDDASKGRLRERGNRLVGALAHFVTRPTAREQTTVECRKIGAEYGEDLARNGLTLTDSIEAFILHRTPVMEAVMEMMGNPATLNKQALTAVPQINKLIDETLLALVETHQQYTAAHKASPSLEGD
ncbi:MAG: helix-turn-helix domain-containing protein, partial [Dehalococcoidia bacterium]|nr:helix-turn-helix domain-containing protein [Dehalococcoidia bacterium]